MLILEAAVAKRSKYAVPESGDTVELVERPRGGISLIMADGQRSGRAAKTISNMVVRKAASLLAEGVRDGAAARAASDYLLASRHGQVSADLVMLTADLSTRSLLVTRNIGCPVLVCQDGQVRMLDEPSSALGTNRATRPQITELPLQAGQCLLAFTDVVLEAGSPVFRPVTAPDWMLQLVMAEHRNPQALADAVLERASRLDSGRPRDDMSVIVLSTSESEASSDVRRMHVIFPVA
jgi:serine phosphatase RsbU (regulator of sigma subunit)